MMETSQQKEQFDTTDRYQEVSSMTRCKTADLIGNLRRKGQKYFHSDSEEDEDEDGDNDNQEKKGDEETSSNSSEYGN